MEQKFAKRHAYILNYQFKPDDKNWKQCHLVVLGTGPLNAKKHLINKIKEVFEADKDYEIYHGLADLSESSCTLNRQCNTKAEYRFHDKSKYIYDNLKELIEAAKLIPAKSIIAFSTDS